MTFLKRARKDGYSVVEIHEQEGTVFKSIRFDFKRINFGKFDADLQRLSERKRYNLLAKIYSELASLGFFAPKTRFTAQGFLTPRLSVRMPKLPTQSVDLPQKKIRKVERHLELDKLFFDVYHVHNYHDFKGEAYFIDLEVFPKR